MSMDIGKERVHFNLARLRKNGYTFEVVVDPDLAIEFRKGKKVDIREVLKSEHIFSDAQKGDLAPQKMTKDLFGTEDELEVARIILENGEIQLTPEYREKLIEVKRKAIADIISSNAVDPRTKLPYSQKRILDAMQEAKVNIDPFKRAGDQVKPIVKEIAKIIPINMESMVLNVKIPAQYSGKVYSIIRASGTVKRESWLSDGSLDVDVELPAAVGLDFMDRINKITHGDNIITKRK